MTFRWQDGERVILFGRGTLARFPEVLAPGFTLLSTGRALEQARGLDGGAELIEAAGAVHEVAAGRVDELAGELRARVRGELLVALGGGRVIDVAKALAAAEAPRRAGAIPTTLSGAEMTAIHRQATGVEPSTPRVRPAVVVADPALSGSQPAREMARSAANSLGHVADGLLTPLANPVATLAGLRAASLLATGLRFADGAPDRDALALGALLAGYVIGSCGYGLHHVLAQTLARFAGIAHGAANAVMLPHSLEALARRSPQAVSQLEQPLGEDPVAVAWRLAARAEATSLSRLGVSRAQLEHSIEEAATRAELRMTPPAAGGDELRALFEAAY
jgi:alcohol dehydrogenase class IV